MSDRKDHYDDPFAFKTLANVIKMDSTLPKKMEDLTCEYGSSHPVRFPNPENVKLYDSENNEICIPKCQKCGIHKCQIIGKNAYMWFCSMCGEP